MIVTGNFTDYAPSHELFEPTVQFFRKYDDAVVVIIVIGVVIVIIVIVVIAGQWLEYQTPFLFFLFPDPMIPVRMLVSFFTRQLL